MSGQDKSGSNCTHTKSIDDGKSGEGKKNLPDESILCDSSSTATPMYSNRSSLSPPKDTDNKFLKEVTFSMSRFNSSKNVKHDGPNAYTVKDLVLKTNEELADLVCSLQRNNERLKVNYSAQKALRKKKEKNLIKLAKQLNVQSVDLEKQNSQIRQLLSTQATLENNLKQHKIDLETVHTTNSKAARDHHNETSDLQAKNRALQTEFQDTVTRISSENGKQVEHLRRQVLQSQLEGDRLRVQLAGFKIEVEGESTKRMDEIIEKTLRDHDNHENESIMEESNIFGCLSSIKFWRVVGFFFGAILIPSIAIAHKMDLLSKSSICAPAMPGTHLHSNLKGDFIFEAPWWVFPSLKKKSFDLFCDKRRRTRIEWLPTVKPDQFKLVVIDLNKVGGEKSGKVANGQVFERKAASITLHSNAIAYENNKGAKQEKRRAPWVPSRNPLRKRGQ